MFLVNLTWLQFAIALGAISAGLVALYLRDRSRKRLIVPTLRFWAAAEQPPEAQRRRKIRQPLSLALQLLAVTLLLLAFAQVRAGSRYEPVRNHVLILDTSAWMGARGLDGTLLREARAKALAYVRGVPAGDRVMLLRAANVPAPATAFEEDRSAVERAIAESKPGSTALHLADAVEFARHAQSEQPGAAGEIVYVGSGRVADDTAALGRVGDVRTIPVTDALPNAGLRTLVARRSLTNPEEWEIAATVRNYGTALRSAQLAFAFRGVTIAERRLTLDPGTEQTVALTHRATEAGRLYAQLTGSDAFPADDTAAIELPAARPVRVAVYTDEPDLLRPALTATPMVAAVFHRTAEYSAAEPADVFVLDRLAPAAPPPASTLYIEPPVTRTPVPVKSVAPNVAVKAWNPEHPIAAGLRISDLRIESSEIFAPEPGDAAVAQTSAGPVLVARDTGRRIAVLGYHPGRGGLRFSLSTPLLFANLLHWLAPDAFRRVEVAVASPGALSVPLDPGAAPSAIEVRTETGDDLPYTVSGNTLRLFSDRAGVILVKAGPREVRYSFSLPEIGATRWNPRAASITGAVRPAANPFFMELWPWLAAAAALVLVCEWLLFGTERRLSLAPRGAR